MAQFSHLQCKRTGLYSTPVYAH